MNSHTSPAPSTSSTANNALLQNDKDEREFLLSKALAFSTILNEIMPDRIDKAPDTEHERGVREGIIFLSWHIEDLLRAYFKPVAEDVEVSK